MSTSSSSSSSPSTFDISDTDLGDEQKIGIDNPDANQIVPILTEKYSISKKLLTQEFTIEKRMVERIETIKVPIKYEEIYVNGKKFGSSKEKEEDTLTWQNLLSKIKGAITDNKKEDKEEEIDQEWIEKKKTALKGELVPLNPNGVIEGILPLYAEEIIINKRMKHIAEAVITKRKVTENKKVTFQVKGEKVTVKYPDGSEQEIDNTTSTATSA